jgi:hypothetical protein
MDEETYRRIEATITSAESPVGIDARKTHVLILGKLEAIEARLAGLEAALAGARASDGQSVPGDR